MARSSFRRNNWLRRDQVLNAQALASHVDRDAYEAKTLSLSAGFERQSNFIWQKKWTWSLGAELVATDERDTIEATGEPRRRTFFIGALPGSLGYDASDDLLDPTKGFRLLGRLSPEISFQGGTFPYARAQIDASAYHPVSDSDRRRRAGSGWARILGADRDDIAPSRRFYSGGGGSVRGYGYQRLGPRDVDDDPIGGRSLAEFSLEARIRLKAFGGNFGIVPFIDGGTLSTDAHARLQGLADRRRASARAIIRASARSGSTSARRSTGRRATAGSPSSSAWGRPSDGRDRRHRARRRRASGSSLTRRKHWGKRLATELLVLLLVLLALAVGGLILLDTAPGPPVHRRPASRRWKPPPASGSGSAGSRGRSTARPG